MSVWKVLKQDLNRYTESNELKYKVFKSITSIGFSSVVLIRFQDLVYQSRFWVIAYALHRVNHSIHGIDVMPGAVIGPGLRIEHPTGIVIGAGAVIGENCVIMQGVTIGARNPYEDLEGDNFPRIGSNVLIGANASLIGPIIVGDSVVIGAGSVVLDLCLPNSTYVGNPARKIS